MQCITEVNNLVNCNPSCNKLWPISYCFNSCLTFWVPVSHYQEGVHGKSGRVSSPGCTTESQQTSWYTLLEDGQMIMKLITSGCGKHSHTLTLFQKHEGMWYAYTQWNIQHEWVEYAHQSSPTSMPWNLVLETPIITSTSITPNNRINQGHTSSTRTKITIKQINHATYPMGRAVIAKCCATTCSHWHFMTHATEPSMHYHCQQQ